MPETCRALWFGNQIAIPQPETVDGIELIDLSW
jgi:hypothetical protein